MDKFKHILDLCAAVGACSGLATFVGWVPIILGIIASLMSIAWYSYRFYQEWKGKYNLQTLKERQHGN